MRPGRNAKSALADAAAHLRAGMAAARRGRESLPELRSRERGLLKSWAAAHGCLLPEDSTLKLERRKSHGEHTVGFDPHNSCWWKTTHPSRAGIGAMFEYEMTPPFSITGIFARELLPSEYLERMLLHNREFGDDIRFEGYLDGTSPSLVISQPDIAGIPATSSDMETQMRDFGYLPLGNLQIGKSNSISFYSPENRIALFDAHPGNFFRTKTMTIPIDGILAEISSDAEHQWLLARTHD